MEQRIQYAKTEDGVSIAYYIIGDGKPLIFLSGGWITSIQLDLQIPQKREFHEALAAGRSLVRLDWRGSGLSDGYDKPLTLEGYLLDLSAVVDALRLERFALLGTSYQGATAVAYTARNPERVTDLVLYCTSPRSRDVFGGPADRALAALREADWELYTEVAAFITSGWDAGDAGRKFAKQIRETTTPDHFEKGIAAIYHHDASDELARVQARTLVIQRTSSMRGQGGKGGLKVARELAAGIPYAELLVLEGDSEQITAGDTAATIAAVSEFLGDLPTSPSKSDTHTILFTDMASSTALTQQLGDATAQEVRRTHNEIVRSALQEHSGNEIKHTGDGIMASFSTASSALDAAIAIQRGVAAHKDANPDSPLAVYVGLNAGEPIAEDDDLFGTSINLASRICDHAEAGQILAADVVRQLAAGKDFSFNDRGETKLRGFEESVRVFEVRWRE
jgi:class 3 adenylate cyclase